MKLFNFFSKNLDLFKITADTNIVACFEPKRRKRAIDNSKWWGINEMGTQ